MPGGDVNPGGQEHHTCTAALGGQGVSPSLQTQRQRGVIPFILLGALSICDMCLASQGWEADNTTIWKEKRRAPPRTALSSVPTSFPRRTADAQNRQTPSEQELLIYLSFHLHKNCIDSILSLGI